MNADDGLKTYLSLAVEEYKTLRDESKQASINMWTAMQWGGAFIGLIAAAALSQWSAPSPATPLALDIAVPIFSLFLMLFWLGEAARFKRAGDYLCLVEQKLTLLLRTAEAIPTALNTEWPEQQRRAEYALNLRPSIAAGPFDFIVEDPVAWEQWLRARKGRSAIDGHLERLYQARLAFFMVLSFGSLGFGVVYFLTSINSRITTGQHIAMLGIGGCLLVVQFGLALAVGLQLRRTMKNIRP